MTTGLRRTLFRRSELVRILSETHPEIADPKCDLGAQLGQWLELSDAMTLFSVLNAEDGGPISSAPLSSNDLPAELQRLRALRRLQAAQGLQDSLGGFRHPPLEQRIQRLESLLQAPTTGTSK